MVMKLEPRTKMGLQLGQDTNQRRAQGVRHTNMKLWKIPGQTGVHTMVDNGTQEEKIGSLQQTQAEGRVQTEGLVINERVQVHTHNEWEDKSEGADHRGWTVGGKPSRQL